MIRSHQKPYRKCIVVYDPNESIIGNARYNITACNRALEGNLTNVELHVFTTLLPLRMTDEERQSLLERVGNRQLTEEDTRLIKHLRDNEHAHMVRAQECQLRKRAQGVRY